MLKRFEIELSGEWVLSRRDDEVYPIEKLKRFAEENLADVLVFNFSSLTQLSFNVVCDDFSRQDVEDKFVTFFNKTYSPVDDTEDILTFEVYDLDSDNAETLHEDKSDLDKPKSQECLDKINSLVACEEFKSLAKEIANIAPEIIKNKTYDVFSYQTYILSINDGYGLTTYLELLNELFSSLEIRKINDVTDVIETKLQPPKGGSDEPFNDARQKLCRGRHDTVQLLCIDISEWINQTNSAVFKQFLTDVSHRMDDFIVVFRVPFVDKEVLEKLRFSLNDLMFVRTLTFPPFSKSEIQKFAEIEFAKYGFRMANNAWNGFHERIVEEKGDGKFYGINTVKKVVRELLYTKQLSNALKGKTDLTISKKDSDAICSSNSHKGVSGYEMLDRLVGGESLKKRINEIISQIELSKQNDNLQAPCVHMRFVGNPGTGKTTVARIIGKILKEKGVLRIGNFYEYAGRDFCGRYIGETAPKTASMCRDAYGSVLFIDEAYSLYRGDDNDRDFGREAIDTLIAEMENHRSDFVVIMAGYPDDMDTLMRGNAGLASRMPYVIEFPNFSREELYEVFVSMLDKQFKYEDDLLSAVKEYFENIPDSVMNSKEFSNARFVRNLFERTWAKASMRCQLSKAPSVTITKSDFDTSVSDKEFTFIMEKKNRMGFA